jgi:hypothetical protein
MNDKAATVWLSSWPSRFFFYPAQLAFAGQQKATKMALKA